MALVTMSVMTSKAPLLKLTALYQTTAQQYATQIVSNAMASTGDHLKLTYQSDDSSWSQLYNAYPDKLFNLGVFDEGFYSMQAAWYAGQACTPSFAISDLHQLTLWPQYHMASRSIRRAMVPRQTFHSGWPASTMTILP